jgi:hypothetical protein
MRPIKDRDIGADATDDVGKGCANGNGPRAVSTPAWRYADCSSLRCGSR